MKTNTYHSWKMLGGFPIRVDWVSWHFGGFRPSGINTSCYQKAFTEGEMKMLRFLVTELQDRWDDPYNDWHKGVQKWLGDIVYNKLGEQENI